MENWYQTEAGDDFPLKFFECAFVTEKTAVNKRFLRFP